MRYQRHALSAPPMDPVRSVYRTLSLPRSGRQVLGPDLNRSESAWGAACAFSPNDSTLGYACTLRAADGGALLRGAPSHNAVCCDG
jgi:hypothetical protein